MASFSNRYEAYKSDTETLASWVARSYKLVQNKSNQNKPNQTKPNHNRPNQNKPNQNKPPAKTKPKYDMTVRDILRRVNEIADHNDRYQKKSKTFIDIPPSIFRLFQSVIKDRTETWNFFKILNSNNPDPKVEASNRSHKFFVESLTTCFKRLGGDDWLERRQEGPCQYDGDDLEVQKNMFSILKDCDDQTDNKSGSSRSSSKPPTTQNHQNKLEEDKEQENSGSRLEDESLKGYGIVDEEGGIDLKYQMASFSLFQELYHLRHEIVSVWEAVAEDKFNIAVAGSLSNTAVAILKRSWMVVSRQFPENDSYEDFLQVMAPGVDPWHRQHKPLTDPTKETDHEPLSGGSDYQEKLQALKELDLKEFYSLYAYQDFIAFVQDFKINRDGSKSKRFKELQGTWDPNIDFRRAPRPNKKQRRKWRRTYTISWLYDLVNVFSWLCEDNQSPNGAKRDPRNADWSFVGGRDGSRHLFGLDEIARLACFLAWKTDITECSKYIKPHHILQLQLIIDSMSVSRGWSEKLITSQIQTPVEHAQNSTPRRDLQRFLHCNDINPIRNFLSSSDELTSRLRVCRKTHGGFRYSHLADIFQTQNDRFRRLLGEPRQKSSKSDKSDEPDGPDEPDEPDPIKLQTRKRLWEHSPFLCGLGPIEALEIAFGTGTLLWNQIPEPVLAVHLHNMLVKQGYIEKSASLYSTLEKSFFFSKSRVPDSDFAEVLQAQITKMSASGSTALHRQFGLPKSADILEILDQGRARKRFASTTTNTTLHRLANWDV